MTVHKKYHNNLSFFAIFLTMPKSIILIQACALQIPWNCEEKAISNVE